MDTTVICAALEAMYQDNRKLIAGLSATDMQRPTPNPKWNVRQLAAHIAEDAGAMLSVGRLLARGKSAKAPDFVVNLANWWTLRKYGKARPTDLLLVMDANHQQALAWVRGLPSGALSHSGEVSQMGQLTLAEFLVKYPEHSRAHASAIHAALARQ